MKPLVILLNLNDSITRNKTTPGCFPEDMSHQTCLFLLCQGCQLQAKVCALKGISQNLNILHTVSLKETALTHHGFVFSYVAIQEKLKPVIQVIRSSAAMSMYSQHI